MHTGLALPKVTQAKGAEDTVQKPHSPPPFRRQDHDELTAGIRKSWDWGEKLIIHIFAYLKLFLQKKQLPYSSPAMCKQSPTALGVDSL